MKQFICISVALLSLSFARAEDKQPSLTALTKFPEDYVGKKFKYKVIVDPSAIARSVDNKDTWVMMLRDASINLRPFVGSKTLLHADKLNYIVSQKQAKELVQGKYGIYDIEFSVKKKNILVEGKQKPYFVTDITSVKLLKAE